jgi:Ca-activated chloride channel family protein
MSRGLRFARYLHKLIFSFAIVFAVSLVGSFQPAAAQTPKPSPVPTATPAEPEIDPDDVISVNTSEVLLPVTVRDAFGRLVDGLTRDDFRIFEDGSQQALSDISLRQVPVDVVLMVDASSSAIQNLDDFSRAAEGFASHLSPDDRVSLIQFDDRVLLLQDWTRSLVQLRRALRRIVPGMFTRFHDAVVLAAKDQKARPSARHAIIVLTDGIDNGGSTSFQVALRGALQSQTAVYVISNTEIERTEKDRDLANLLSGTEASIKFNQLRIQDLRMGLAALAESEKNLQELTSATGGRLYRPKSFQDLEAVYTEVANELGHQYGLYYSPLNKKRDGQFRKVRVETLNSTHKVYSRVGYYAPVR